MAQRLRRGRELVSALVLELGHAGLVCTSGLLSGMGDGAGALGSFNASPKRQAVLCRSVAAQEPVRWRVQLEATEGLQCGVVLTLVL